MASGQITSFRINQRGVDELQTRGMEPFVFKVAETAAAIARGLVNVDSGELRSTIGTAFETAGGVFVGFVTAGTAYAIWQEFEPGEVLPTGGTRKRRGGKAFLRPGIMQALQPYTG